MIQVLVFFALQFVLFFPFYLIWRRDCEEIGKDNLALSLADRFFYWVIFCPMWLVGLIA